MVSSVASAPKTAPAGGRRGVTLLELLITIVMIGILSGIAASKLNWTRYRADAVARGVMSELSAAQRLAVSLQANVRVTLPATGRMQIHEDADNDGNVDSGERVRQLPLDHSFVFAKSTASDTPSPADATTLSTLVFRRDGSANRGGTFYISGPGSDPSCKNCRALAIARATGRIVYYSNASGSWKRAN